MHENLRDSNKKIFFAKFAWPPVKRIIRRHRSYAKQYQSALRLTAGYMYMALFYPIRYQLLLNQG